MIQFLHRSWAFIVVIMFVITLVKYILSLTGGKRFTYATDFRLALFTLITLYIQIALGLFTWFTSKYFQGILDGKMGELMKQSHSRLLTIEHPVMMLIVLLLVHYGFNRMKKSLTDKKRFMPVIIFYGIGFLLILLRIPWSTWL